MPGIAGIITRNPDGHLSEAQLSKMLLAMRHDSSAAQGSFSDPERGIYLGWVNHAGICSSAASADGDITVVSHGEHFSHRPEELGAGDGTPAAILRAFEGDPDVFPRTLNGWFTGVVVERSSRKVLLFNDRYGVQRIYYSEQPDCFVFASEAKAVLAIVPQLRSLDSDAVGQYLGYGSVFGNKTLFKNLSLLPAGSCWSIGEPHAIAKRRYFDPSEWEDQPALEPEKFHRALSDTIRRILPSYFASPEPVGLSLTGGLDTRMVIAGLPADDERRPCYTYGGVYRDCFDIEVARRISNACNLPHTVLPLRQDFFTNFREYAERSVWVTDGCLDLTGAHEIYYSTAARALSSVRLTGNYGSEVLRSVSTFKFSPVTSGILHSDVVGPMKSARQEHNEYRAGHPVTFAAFRDIPWHLAGRRLAAESVLVLRSPYMDNELVQLLYQAPPGARETAAASVRVIRELSPRLGAIATDMGHGGHALPPFGELNRLYRYILFKAEWYYNLGMPDSLVRYERLLPFRVLEPLFLGTHKIEHYRLWCRDQLRAPLLDILSETRSASRPYVTRSGVHSLLEDFADNRRNSVVDVCRLASLELVQRKFIDGSPA
jgi:asparagine synthase (glutamine-hydrolysing)